MSFKMEFQGAKSSEIIIRTFSNARKCQILIGIIIYYQNLIVQK